MGVSMMPRSSMMGNSVPMAVVVSAMVTATPSIVKAGNVGQATTTTKAKPRVMNQVTMPRRP